MENRFEPAAFSTPMEQARAEARSNLVGLSNGFYLCPLRIKTA